MTTVPPAASYTPTETQWVDAELVRNLIRVARNTQLAGWLLIPIYLGVLWEEAPLPQLAAWALAAGTAADDAGLACCALALASGLGKKVALWPLWTCHWSHSRTMEKPKITQRMVRRMSFMWTSSTKEK